VYSADSFPAARTSQAGKVLARPPPPSQRDRRMRTRLLRQRRWAGHSFAEVGRAHVVVSGCRPVDRHFVLHDDSIQRVRRLVLPASFVTRHTCGCQLPCGTGRVVSVVCLMRVCWTVCSRGRLAMRQQAPSVEFKEQCACFACLASAAIARHAQLFQLKSPRSFG